MKEEKEQLRKSVSDTEKSKSKGPEAAGGLVAERADKEPMWLKHR